MAASALVMTASAMAGGAAVSAVTAFAAIGQVGMIMSVAGMVTGDKELTKWGGTLGVIGGVGGGIAGLSEGLATDALNAASVGENGALSTNSWTGAEGEYTNGSSAWDTANDAAASAVESSNKAAKAAIDAGPQPGALIDFAGKPMQPALDVGAQGLTTSLPVQAPVQAVTNVQATVPPTATPSAQPGVQANTSTATPASSTPAPDVSGVNKTKVAGIENPGAGSTNTDGYWNSFKAFVKDNDKLVGMGLQTVGGALKGVQQQQMFDRQQGLKEQDFANRSAIPSLGPRSLIQSARAV